MKNPTVEQLTELLKGRVVHIVVPPKRVNGILEPSYYVKGRLLNMIKENNE